MHPTVSIVTPLYQSESFIDETIRSVVSQTFEDWEMIVVDDCSTDNGPGIVTEWCGRDNRIQLVHLAERSGAAKARNRGIELATGRYIAFLDSDDSWLPQKLETQLHFMSSHNIAFTYSYYRRMDTNGGLKQKAIRMPLRLTYKQLLRTCHIGCLTAVYDTQILGKQYMPDIARRQDYGLWLQILRQIPMAYGVNEYLAIYRQRSGSISRNKFRLLKYNYQLFREHESFPARKALYYLLWNVLYKVLS